ncbi:GDP-L-galactose phosphorylase 1-like [Punica granatum]|uniref:GDP-D-glucose phosphorylase 1 n=2 Tax=Punica granatum TaxID=22663 RepID=A0A218XL00_PUNGR|nr:GDP-L-galactose phosphorylase 1-like [Punica granatum]OWM84992.1 hypothetical protein CDL15_Pgr027779 [Punica granatum]PKI68399.1 hypothetical protein CRG98_011196 [Punica granatum]
MLTIRRVATVVSNYQEDGTSEKVIRGEAKGCGRNCLGRCCLPASRLPLYAFKKDGGLPVVETITCAEHPPMSFLLSMLLGQWEDRKDRGLFRYDVTTCETKIIPGKYGFIAQLNEGRLLKKRPTEFRVDQVLQPFDENKFNFTKVGQDEVLFAFEQSYDLHSRYFPSVPVTSVSSSPNVVAINVSPIEYGHVLLIPRILDHLPQRIDHESLLLALRLAEEVADPFFRVGYNSLGAFATINHLHFQAYYSAATFPAEKAPTEPIVITRTPGGLQERGITVSKLLGYPVRSLELEGGDSMQELCNVVVSSCICLQNNNIPFNLLISDCGKRVFLFPQCYAEKQAFGEVSPELLNTQVNPAVWEISGHMVLKRWVDYDNASEAYAWRLLVEVSLSEQRFQEVKDYILEALGVQEEMGLKYDEAISESPATETRYILHDCPVEQ